MKVVAELIGVSIAIVLLGIGGCAFIEQFVKIMGAVF